MKNRPTLRQIFQVMNPFEEVIICYGEKVIYGGCRCDFRRDWTLNERDPKDFEVVSVSIHAPAFYPHPTAGGLIFITLKKDTVKRTADGVPDDILCAHTCTAADCAVCSERDDCDARKD